MSRPAFSKDHRTYGEWLNAQPRTSRYAKEIIRKHQYFSDKSLSQLRNLRISDYDRSQVSWKNLASKQKSDRNLSLQVLRGVRKDNTLTESLEKTGVKKQFALRNLGTNLKKSGGRWQVTKTDSLQSEMMIYSNGKVGSIVLTNSRDRSRIGEYFSAVNKALNHGDTSDLDKFKHPRIVDAQGNVHRFETDLEKLYEIQETIEEPEFLEIYRD